MAQTPEGVVKDEVKQVLHEQGFIRAGMPKSEWPHPVRGWYYMPVQNGMGVHGIPDFVCCENGWFLGIETKAPGKVDNLSDNQKERIGEIQHAFGEVIVTDSAQYLREVLEGRE